MNKRLLWKAFLRVLIVLLMLLIVVAVYLSLNPATLASVFLALPGGFGEMPDLGPTPQAPVITAPRGEPPAGQLGSWGYSNAPAAPEFGCTTLVRMPDGRKVAISTAHSTYPQAANVGGRLVAPDSTKIADLVGQLKYGAPFQGMRLNIDYVLWTLKTMPPEEDFVEPDPRGAPQPGERVWLYNMDSRPNGVGRRAGVVMQVNKDNTWLRMDESFVPGGSSGCPVVSQHTGKLLGTVVAGADSKPVVIGLHPVASLVERVNAALPPP
jgi:hypothetical protein